MEATGIDGFNLAYAINPGSFEDVVDFIVPELRRRGRYAQRASNSSLRKHLFDRSDRLPAGHIGASFVVPSAVSCDASEQHAEASIDSRAASAGKSARAEAAQV